MQVITVTYTLIWEVKFANEYAFTKCGKCFNRKRGKEMKQVMQGGSIGYNIRSKFYTLKRLRNNLVKINNYKYLSL